MYQSNFSPHTMVHLVGGYQANGQFVSLPNHAFYTSNPNGFHPDLQYNHNTPNHNRQRISQRSYSSDFLHGSNVELQNSNYDVHHASGINPNWPQRTNSSNDALSISPRMNSSDALHMTPVRARMSAEHMRKNHWNNANNKINKKNSFQDLPSNRDSCNSSDSGLSSRSPTPNRHLKSNSSQAESSDDRDSLSSASESTYKNRSNRTYRGNLMTSLSTSNLYQDKRWSNEFTDTASQHSTQNYQNRRRYPTAKTSPTSQKIQRARKFNGTFISEINVCPKYYPHSPVDKFLERSHLIQVRQRPSNLFTGSVYDKLSKAIWDKFEQNQLSQSTFCHKMYLWRYLFFYIKSRFPHYGLFMVGSTLNGFGTDASDVDMCLQFRDTAIDQRSEAIYRLTQIMTCLRRSEFISHLELIQAKVPILKIRDRVYNLEVDLNYNNVVGVRNTHLLYCYSKIDWRVRPLVLVVKMWAQCQNINDARHMTISSYSLVLMVIHFLQCGVSPAVLPCLHRLFKDKFNPVSDIHSIDIHEELVLPNDALYPRNNQTLGELLIEFFKYYDSFDYDQFAISIRVANKIPIDACRHVRSFKNDPHQWKYLCVEEPFDHTNTARSVYDPSVFKLIKDVFKQTYKRLKKTNNLTSIFTRLEDSQSN
ncbi:hypothetical protein QAD02_022864 [Eretmocerus hayati]|uniref:Uncharacterized protein n=1 Tax=Eretmocerus hayati TaxID=131215 RepID=A0ACC2PTZ0_9HYME|nr:hypothetical protein QAD02_022864 [Eretmocerus hayati]